MGGMKKFLLGGMLYYSVILTLGFDNQLEAQKCCFLQQDCNRKNFCRHCAIPLPVPSEPEQLPNKNSFST